ncbi:hypothetical protein ACFWGI_37620 [Streptomyces niveus]|uniref:hypothetical protein n=1 Tax=Streptomyces niveus TaxID=193462 RepID=UPI00365C85BA
MVAPSGPPNYDLKLVTGDLAQAGAGGVTLGDQLTEQAADAWHTAAQHVDPHTKFSGRALSNRRPPRPRLVAVGCMPYAPADADADAGATGPAGLFQHAIPSVVKRLRAATAPIGGCASPPERRELQP